MQRTASTILTILIVLLLFFGIVMLYSTSYSAFGEDKLARQLTWIVVGGAGAMLLRSLDYRVLGRLSWVGLAAVSLVLAYLALAQFLYGYGELRPIVDNFPFVAGQIKGSFRWLRFGPFKLQPSEFAKPAIILFLADYYNRRTRHVHEFWRGFLRPMMMVGCCLGLILLGRDLSTTVITGAVIGILAFVAGVRLRYLLPVFAAVFLGGMWVLTADPVHIAKVLSKERAARIVAYRDPEAEPLGDGYQLWSSQLALGSGGGRGLGFTNSRMKQRYLPEAHTDFIVAIVGEELGYIGVLALLLLYVAIMVVAFWLAGLVPDRTGMLICVGVGLFIGLQAFVNISVVSGFCPTTGVTAPFVSYGGSSMVASLLGFGLILSVVRIGMRDALERELGRTVHIQGRGRRRARFHSQVLDQTRSQS